VAREVLGTAAYQSGDLAKARDIYAGIQEDAETPPDLWIRSGLMISLINGQLAEPAADEAGSDASPAPEEGEAGANPAAPPEPAPAAEADPASAGSGGNP
jgi:hypothetical protein